MGKRKTTDSKTHWLTSFLGIKSFLLLCVIFIAGCGGVNSGAPTVRKIDEELRRGAGTVFGMKSVTDFAWDRFFVFEPYTLRKTIHETIGFPFLRDTEVPLSVDEAYCLLVFMNEGRVVEYFTYHRSRGDFDRVSKKTDGFSTDEAFFEVVSDYDGKWKRIKQVNLERVRY